MWSLSLWPFGSNGSNGSSTRTTSSDTASSTTTVALPASGDSSAMVAVTQHGPQPGSAAHFASSALFFLNDMFGFAGQRSMLDNGMLFATYGIALALGRTLFDWSYGALRYAAVAHMEIDSRDESYDWILSYLTDPNVGNTFNHFAVTTMIRGNSTTSLIDSEESIRAGKLIKLPAHGSHTFYHNGYRMWLTRCYSSSNDRGTTDMIHIDCLGPRSALESLIKDAQQLYLGKDRHRTIVYACDQYGAWRRIRSRLARRLDTVITAGAVKETILRDITEFMGSEAWYTSRGIPYRRGYMFHGPPGTGKTSLVTALAGELGLNIYTVSLANKNLTDDGFIEALVDTPLQCILLLEDIDAAFKHRKSTSSRKNGITFAGLLNAIDGVAAQEGRVLCMTTNHFDVLDPALVRPGRVDVIVEFQLANKIMVRDLFLRFYDNELPFALSMANKVPEHTFSLAEIQGFLMAHKQDPKGAVDAVDDWIVEQLMKKGTASSVITESSASGKSDASADSD